MSQMFLFYFILYGGALVFLGGAGAPASPSLAPPMAVADPKLWNSLPSVRIDPTLSAFKTSLKHIFIHWHLISLRAVDFLFVFAVLFF